MKLLPPRHIYKSTSTTITNVKQTTQIQYQDVMPIRDILKKKGMPADNDAPGPGAAGRPVFTFIRSDTDTQEIISPSDFSSSADSSKAPSFVGGRDGNNESRTSRFFKGRAQSSSHVFAASPSTARPSEMILDSKPPHLKRLSQRLHLRRSEISSSNVPTDLPEITAGDEGDGGPAAESQWEKRATMLAKKNELERSRQGAPVGSTTDLGTFSDLTIGRGGHGHDKHVVSTKYVDDNIQEAIRLHEAGDMETSTQMFGRLADPNGENNALSQVLYGLALR